VGTVEDRLAQQGLKLPPRRSAGKYVGAVRIGDLVHVSGGGPVGDKGLITGKVGADLDVSAAQQAAGLAALYCLAAVKEELGDLDNIRRIVKITGYVNSAPGFSEQHVVMDGASGLLLSLFGERGEHGRTSIGVAELPMNIAVEVEMIVQADSARAPAGG
jgi:enamine deaminase RidA (YjgF/YER057c/UK114 family)